MHAHGVRESGSGDVLTTAVTTLATSLAAALQPPCSESSHNSAHSVHQLLHSADLGALSLHLQGLLS